MSTATATKNEKKTETVKAEPKISEAVHTLAKVFTGYMKADKDGAVVVSDNMVEDNLPEDLSVAIIRRVQKHRAEVVAAAALALSEVGLPVLKKNKDVEKAHTNFKIVGDKVELAIDREREIGDDKGGKVQKAGYLSLSYTATGATNAGEFAKVRKHISNEATALFG